ncbi:hypothetical protein HMPREF3190_00598 [Umbribacter vaginalis]|nr:hypothetical protein HMPREF3190_00598 [Coriobacteriales bacterium DNF00809]
MLHVVLTLHVLYRMMVYLFVLDQHFEYARVDAQEKYQHYPLHCVARKKNKLQKCYWHHQLLSQVQKKHLDWYFQYEMHVRVLEYQIPVRCAHQTYEMLELAEMYRKNENERFAPDLRLVIHLVHYLRHTSAHRAMRRNRHNNEHRLYFHDGKEDIS